MSNPKGIFLCVCLFHQRNIYWLIEWTLYLETSSAKIEKQHATHFFEVCFNWYNAHRWRYIKIMSKLYLVCQKSNIKTYNFTVVTSSFLEVKTIAGYILKSRSAAFFKMRVSLTRCYKYHISIIIKPFLGVKRNSLRS